MTADLGNSRCKLRVWRLADGGAELDAAEDLEGEERLVERIDEWLSSLGSLDGAALSCVAPTGLEERVAGVLRSGVAGDLDRGPDAGLEVLYRAPERLGRDRLYAVRGALDTLGRSCVVVDAGTTITVDAARYPRTFAGGAIAPGPELLSSALAGGAARLFAVEPRPGTPALGRDTEGALAAGCTVGFRGAAAALVEGVAAEADLAEAPVALTGGASPFLLEPEPFTRRELFVLPDLVHRGLLAAAGRA